MRCRGALNLVIAAIVYWNASYMDKATDHLRRQGRLPEPSLLRHISPLGWDHIVLTGDYDLIHPLILLSNDTKDSLEYPLLHKHLQKPLHQWTDSLIRPVGNMVIQHQPLTKQRMRTIFHRVRL